jgi:hypothetical protein
MVESRLVLAYPTLQESHTMLLNCRHVSDENLLLAYLDLTGTKRFYENSELPEQIERISQVVCAIHAEIDNTFGKDKTNLFVHMYADSLVIAQKNLIGGCAGKLVELMLKVQYQVLLDSKFIKVKSKDSEGNKLMPTLSRALVKRGPYYGMICSEMQQSIDNIFSNFSLVGGSAIVKMNDALEGLPMGTYIDASLVMEAEIAQERLIDITDESGSKFVKPRDGFDSLRSTLSPIQNGPADIKVWVEQLIESSGNDQHFRNKITPWVDVVRGACQSICRTHSYCHPRQQPLSEC